MSPELNKLTDHETKVMLLLVETLEGVVQGFPDTPRKMRNVARAWAAFMSLDQYQVKFDPEVEKYMTVADKEPFLSRQGVIPGEWLARKVRDECEWMPAPVAARRMYCAAGFRPADGIRPSDEFVRSADKGGEE